MSDPILDLKRELEAAAERHYQRVAAPTPRTRRFALTRTRVLVLAATLGIAVALASVVAPPWSSSPSFLEQARAALAHDAGVLHATWELTTTSTDGRCTVTRGPNEIWIDEAPPYRYRAFMHDFPPDSNCANNAATEIGGTFEPLRTLVFEPPITLRNSHLLFNMPPDPARLFREALERGFAHDEGDVELDGRTVRRIRVDACPDGRCNREPGYVYVDPDNFHPVEMRGPGYFAETKVADIVFRYRTFEYLPGRAANVALTDIQAQHPNAVVVDSSPGS